MSTPRTKMEGMLFSDRSVVPAVPDDLALERWAGHYGLKTKGVSYECSREEFERVARAGSEYMLAVDAVLGRVR